MEKLALALKGASEPVRKRFFDNMSSRTAGDLTETLQSMPQTRRKNVDEAQQEIVEIIRRLEEAEEIIINRGGEANEVI
jgi:flagellar motor switch protein FliG